MQLKPFILIGGGMLACALMQRQSRSKPVNTRPVKWWQKLLGVVAVVMAMVIVLNPEFLALGILGDTAFFDLLVLLLSIQMQEVGIQAWRWAKDAFSGFTRFTIRHAYKSYLGVIMFLLAIGELVSSIQNVVRRIFPDANSVI